MKRLIYGLGIFFLFACNAIAQPANSAWPMYGNDAGQSHSTTLPGPTKPVLKWRLVINKPWGDTGVSTYRQPIIGPDSTIYCLSDTSNGSTLNGSYPFNGLLYAVNTNGTLKWKFEFTDGFPAGTSPAIGYDGTIYVHINGNEANIATPEKLYAINPDGTLKWIYSPMQAVFLGQVAPPNLGKDGSIYFGTMGAGFFQLKSDGTLNNFWEWHSSLHNSPPLGPNGEIFWNSAVLKPNGDTLFVLDPPPPQKFNYNRSFHTVRYIDTDGYIYMSNLGNDTLYVLNPDRTLNYKVAIPKSKPQNWDEKLTAIGKKMLLFMETDRFDNNFYLFNKEKKEFKELVLENDAQSQSPIFDGNDVLYFPADDGIHAFNTDGNQIGQLIPGWPFRFFGFSIGYGGKLYALANFTTENNTEGYSLCEYGDIAPGNEVLLSQIPKEYSLYQNYPNPFNPSTTIHYEIPAQTRVILTIYDFLGRQVTKLEDEIKQAGRYQVQWVANGLASGIYFYHLQAGPFSETKKLMLLR